MNAEAIEVSVKVTVTPSVAGIGDLRIVVELKNEGESVVQLNTLSLQSATTALRMRGPDQAPIKPGPPPVPPVDDGKIGRVTLAPHESVTFRYSGRDYTAGRALSPGRYEVMFRYENVRPDHADWVGSAQSSWVSFEVRPG